MGKSRLKPKLRPGGPLYSTTNRAANFRVKYASNEEFRKHELERNRENNQRKMATDPQYARLRYISTRMSELRRFIERHQAMIALADKELLVLNSEREQIKRDRTLLSKLQKF
jgi:viroplasmin and RNaseH domain-containing protein